MQLRYRNLIFLTIYDILKEKWEKKYMRNDTEVNYDALCYATMLNIKTKTSGAKRIVFRNFDWQDKEHKFVMAVTMACWNILGEREVAIDGSIFDCAKITRQYKKICKVKQAKANEEVFVDVSELLEFMRPHAEGICGEGFYFGDIYDAYYSEKGKDR